MTLHNTILGKKIAIKIDDISVIYTHYLDIVTVRHGGTCMLYEWSW